jgi:hypothetical protein
MSTGEGMTLDCWCKALMINHPGKESSTKTSIYAAAAVPSKDSSGGGTKCMSKKAFSKAT